MGDKAKNDDRGSAATIAAIERAADVLLFMARWNARTVGVTEIANGLGMSKAVVHRIVSSLRDRGFVDVDAETRRYSLGPAALTIGAAYLDNLDIREVARESLQRLIKATDETATLSIRDGWSRVYIDQATPDREVKMSVRLGVPFPLHAGGSSKAFLAFLPPAEIDRYLSQPSLIGMTTLTITEPAALRDELAQIRERGYSTSLGERQAGAASVAAPILDRHGEPVAVVSVSGPKERFEPNMAAAADQLLAETRDLSLIMGWQPPT